MEVGRNLRRVCIGSDKAETDDPGRSDNEQGEHYDRRSSGNNVLTFREFEKPSGRWNSDGYKNKP